MLCDRPAKGAELDKATCKPVKCEVKYKSPSDPNSRYTDCTPVAASPASATAPTPPPTTSGQGCKCPVESVMSYGKVGDGGFYCQGRDGREYQISKLDQGKVVCLNPATATSPQPATGLKSAVLPVEPLPPPTLAPMPSPLQQFIPGPPTALGGAPVIGLGSSVITPPEPEHKVAPKKKAKAKKPSTVTHGQPVPVRNPQQEAADAAATAAAIGIILGTGAAIAGSRIGRSGGHRAPPAAPMAPSGHHRR
jgi:hypothetical protein